MTRLRLRFLDQPDYRQNQRIPLGAQRVNPKAQTYLVNTSSWCDPLKQKEAAAALISEGADVLTQHQDYQSTVIQAAKAAGKCVVGYHYDAESLDRPVG